MISKNQLIFKYPLVFRKMLVFPRGNASDGDVSFYLTVARDMPRNNAIHVDFVLTIINQVDLAKSKSRGEAYHPVLPTS